MIRSASPSLSTSPAEATEAPAVPGFGPDELIGPRAGPVEIRIGDEIEVDHPVGRPIGGIGGGQIGAADQIGLARIRMPPPSAEGPDDQIGQTVIVDIPGRGDAPAGIVAAFGADELIGPEPMRSKSGSVMKSRSMTPSAVPSAASAAARSAPLIR
jgi:hypothetical protein